MMDWLYINCSPRLISVLAILLIFIQAYLINFFVNSNKLNSKNSQLAGLIFSLGLCLLPNFLTLHPLMIANTFIILMLMEVTKIYKTFKPIKALFMSGFYTGIAIIIVPHNLFLALFLIQALFVLRDVNFREFLQMATGIAIPIFLCSVYNLEQGVDLTEFMQINLRLPKMLVNFDVRILVGSIMAASMIGYIIGNQNKLRKKKSIKSQKIVSLLYILMLYTIPMMFFSSAVFTQHVTTLIVPVSILYAMLLFVTKKLLLAELIHLAMIVFIILLQFGLIL